MLCDSSLVQRVNAHLCLSQLDVQRAQLVRIERDAPAASARLELHAHVGLALGALVPPASSARAFSQRSARLRGTLEAERPADVAQRWHAASRECASHGRHLGALLDPNCGDTLRCGIVNSALNARRVSGATPTHLQPQQSPGLRAAPSWRGRARVASSREAIVSAQRMCVCVRVCTQRVRHVRRRRCERGRRQMRSRRSWRRRRADGARRRASRSRRAAKRLRFGTSGTASLLGRSLHSRAWRLLWRGARAARAGRVRHVCALVLIRSAAVATTNDAKRRRRQLCVLTASGTLRSVCGWR